MDAVIADGREPSASQAEAAPPAAIGVRWRVPMVGRDPGEDHRASTPLELLFDLCFVVAVAQAAAALHHDLSAGQVGHGLFSYLIVFFTIWWPWVNFTWFASAYDTDDVPYRLLTFVQIAGVLVVAAGVPRIFDELDFSIAVVGYVIMRAALVVQWLRAAREDPVGRRVAIRFAAGVAAVQLLWVARLLIGGPAGAVLIFVFGALELLVPVWAERSGRHTPWHPDHIRERYGLFTIIVLGECVLAATTAVQEALTATGVSVALVSVALGGLLLVFAMWWSYFKAPAAIGHFRSLGWMIAWGYGHYAIFAAVAALGAGLQVAADAVADPAHLAPLGAGLTVAVPAVVFLAAIAVLHRRGRRWSELTSLGVTAVAALALAVAAGAIGVPFAILGMGIVFSASVGWHVVDLHREAVLQAMDS
jgi:low temperature requirement protein LtrA